MKRAVPFVFIAAFAAAAADNGRILTASFPDGTGVEIRTETTGSSPVDTIGQMGIAPGVGSLDLVNRVVLDRANHILFAYNLEASHGAIPGTVRIRILPLTSASENAILGNGPTPRYGFPGGHIPTVVAIREFPDVRISQVVTLDILYNPSTGEKIFDILRPVLATRSGMSVYVAVLPETISLKDVAILVNGRTLAAPASFLTGSAVRIDLPHLGTYVLGASDPHQAGFEAIARVDGKILTWTSGRARIEITSATNILTSAGKGTLWLYHDPHYQPDVVSLQSADTVDWLLPKR